MATADEVEVFPEAPEGTLEVDIGLTNLQAIHQYATSPIYLQRMAYIQGMGAAAAEAGHTASSQVLLPTIEGLLTWDDEDLREAVADQLSPIASAWQASAGEAAQADICSLLTFAREFVHDDSEEVAAAAEAAIAGTALVLTSANRKLQLLPLIDGLNVDDEEDLVGTGARLAGKVAPAFSAEQCEAELLSRLLVLAEDHRWSVRKEVALALGELAQHLPPAACCERLLPCYMQLAADEVWAVRKECACLLPVVAGLVPLATRRRRLVPLFDRLASDVSHWVRDAMLEHLGPFLATLEAIDVSTGMLQQFCSMAVPDPRASSEALPQACAFNFPAMLAVAGAPRWSELAPTYQQLVRSPSWPVRRSLAAAMHEMAGLLGPQITRQYLWPAIQDLAHDTVPEVQAGLQQNMAALLAHLPHDLRAVHVSLLSATLSHDCHTWRGRVSLVEQMGPAADLLDLQGLSAALLPCALACCRDAVAAVRDASAATVGLLLVNLLARCSDHTQPQQDHNKDTANDVATSCEGNGANGTELSASILLDVTSTHDASASDADVTGALTQLTLAEGSAAAANSNKHPDNLEEALHVLHNVLRHLCSLSAQPTYQLRQTFVCICQHLGVVADNCEVVSALIPCLMEIAGNDKVAHLRGMAAEVLQALAAQHPHVREHSTRMHHTPQCDNA